jgi:hypothetical protein
MKIIPFFLLLLAGAIAPMAALAQIPAKTVRIIVPHLPAGGRRAAAGASRRRSRRTSDSRS